jgi:hypothetical protein
MQNITNLRACATVSQRKLANGVQKSQLEQAETIRYDLPTLDQGLPQQIFVQPRGWRKPEIKAADAAGNELAVGSRLQGFHRVYVVTDGGGNTTVYDPKENTLHFASKATDSNCESIAGGMAHIRSWRRTTTQSLAADGTLTVKANQQVERDTFRGGVVGYKETCLMATLAPGQPVRVENYSYGTVENDTRRGQGSLQGNQLQLTDADQKSHQVQLYLAPPR